METLLGFVVIGVLVWAARSAWRGAGSIDAAPPYRGSAAPPYPPPGPPPYRGRATDRESPDEAFASGYVIGRHLADDDARHEDVVDGRWEPDATADSDWGADGFDDDGDPDG